MEERAILCSCRAVNLSEWWQKVRPRMRASASPLPFGETAAGDVWSQEGLTRIQTLLRWFQGLRTFASSSEDCRVWKWLRSQVVGRKPSMATAATPKFSLRLKKTLLMIVGGGDTTRKKEHCKWLVLIKIMFDTHKKQEAIRSCIRNFTLIKPKRKSQDLKKLKTPSYSTRRM